MHYYLVSDALHELKLINLKYRHLNLRESNLRSNFNKFNLNFVVTQDLHLQKVRNLSFKIKSTHIHK